MEDDESSNWDLGNATKQSITEVLHNPRGPTLELPDVSSFDLSSTSLSLTPAPIPHIPEPLNINHFETYLRQYEPLHAAYVEEKSKVVPTQASLDTIPQSYFQPNFSVLHDQSLCDIQRTDIPINDNPSFTPLQTQLTSYRQTLEQQLNLKLDQQSDQITQALNKVQHLRNLLTESANSLRETREKASQLAPIIAKPIKITDTTTKFQTNLRKLREAAVRIQLVASAPADVALLLETGEYEAAIDTVSRAKQALSDKDLSAIDALVSTRGKLAQSVETIDTKLRDEFRRALADGSKETLYQVVKLVDKMGRLPLLQRFFVSEIKKDVAIDIDQAKTLENVGNFLKNAAKRIVMVVNIVNGQEDLQAKPELNNGYLEEVKKDLEDLLSKSVDKILKSKIKGESDLDSESYVVVIPDDQFREENCFDEFKAALRFGEQIHYLENLIRDLDEILPGKRGSSSLRAKISERQLAFLGAFHKAHVDAVTDAVQGDRWQEKPFPDAAIRLLTSMIIPLISSATSTKDEATENNCENENEKEKDRSIGKHNNALMYGPTVYKTVNCGIRYVRSMCTYALLVERSPKFAAELARRGAELSRLFNSLVGRAILGAEALQWAGLRSITVRHLSLASRTIAMSIALAPHLTKPLHDALSGNQAEILIPLIDKSEQDLRDHHSRLLAKILTIMMERLEAHESTLRGLPWNKQQEMKRFPVPSPYITTLVKEATVLHRILWSTLPKSEVVDIFRRVCAAYGNHLEDAYSSLDGGKKWIRERVAHDASYLYKDLGSLDVCIDTPDTLNPVTKLYKRFAKETLEAERDSSNNNRSFIFKPKVSPDANGDMKTETETGSNGVPNTSDKETTEKDNEKEDVSENKVASSSSNPTSAHDKPLKKTPEEDVVTENQQETNINSDVNKSTPQPMKLKPIEGFEGLPEQDSANEKTNFPVNESKEETEKCIRKEGDEKVADAASNNLSDVERINGCGASLNKESTNLTQETPTQDSPDSENEVTVIPPEQIKIDVPEGDLLGIEPCERQN